VECGVVQPRSVRKTAQRCAYRKGVESTVTVGQA
tara:strand:+ start:128856 stop:128957 length:102 start_codon:yes stop_codon:yes gene_type:complete